jgi:hypothetical protein
MAELRDAYPDLADAFERALVRFEDGVAAMGLSGRQRQQVLADMFRAALSDEVAMIGRVEDDVEHGNRNSIVLRPHGAKNVRVRVLCRPQRGGVPSANSRARLQEFRQGDLFAGDSAVSPTVVTLTLTWCVTEKGVDLALAMPISAGTRRHSPTLAWLANMPLVADDVAAVEPDIDHDDDLDIIVPKPAAEVEDGDDPA